MLPNLQRLALRPAGATADDGGARARGPMPKIDPNSGESPFEQLSHELVNVVYDNLLRGDDPDAICKSVKAFCATRKKEFGEAKLGAWCTEEMWKKACAALRVEEAEMARDFSGWSYKRTFLALCGGLHELTPEQRVAWFQGVGDVTRRKAWFKTPPYWKKYDRALVVAANSGNTEGVRRLIAEGADVNYLYAAPPFVSWQPSSVGWFGFESPLRTALFEAALQGFGEIARLLVENGADVNIPNEVRKTPLSVACGLHSMKSADEIMGYTAGTSLARPNRVSYEIANLLIDNGADVNRADKHGATPLIYACFSGSSDIVAKLLQRPDIDTSRADERGSTALHTACMSGSLESVTMLLSRPGVDVNRPNGIGNNDHFTRNMRPLVIALWEGYADIALALLDRDDINVDSNDNEQGLLITASDRGMRTVVERLIQRGVDVNAQGYWALIAACRNRHSDVALTLLDTNDFDLNGPDGLGQNLFTPLHMASMLGMLAVVRRLIQLRVDINARTHNGDSSLKLACEHKQTRIALELLAEDGIDVDPPPLADMNALYWARVHNMTRVAELLREKGASINIEISKLGNPFVTALEKKNESFALELVGEKYDTLVLSNDQRTRAFNAAVKHKLLEAVRILLANKNEQNLSQINNKFILYWASEMGRINIVRLLIDQEIDVNARREDGMTALHLAAQNGKDAVVKLLVANGANPNVQDAAGNTPIEYALENKKINVVKTLSQKGVRPGLRNGRNTPLHDAVKNGLIGAVNAMIQAGVNLDAQDKRGRTALHWAAAYDFPEIAKLLVEHMAKINVQDDDGNTALIIACRRNNTYTALELLKHPDINVNVLNKVDEGARYWAEKNDISEVVGLLIRKGAADTKPSGSGVVHMDDEELNSDDE